MDLAQRTEMTGERRTELERRRWWSPTRPALWTVTAALVLLRAAVLSGQQEGPVGVPITLQEAVGEALAGNPGHRIAGERAAMARADARVATSRLLPRLEVGAGLIRSVDPVFAFGTKLRQERFGQEDFALDALNRPDPITDWSAETGVRWSAVDAGRWAGRTGARRRARAVEREEEWSRERTVFRTKALYYEAAGAGAGLEAAEVAEEAARATLELFQRRRREGLLTEADVLQAEAELRSAEARRLDAARSAERAREELALHLGWELDRLPVPTDGLTAPPPPAAPPAAPSTRADIQSLAAARSAAQAEAKEAGLAFLPTLEGFAGWTSHAGDVFDVEGSDWTAGLALRWTLFSGLGRVAERQRAVRAREIARIRYDDAVRTARAEAGQAHRDVTAAWGGLRASRAAESAAEEARALMRRRFEEGLATATELLQAEARATGARGRAVEAGAAYHVALARLELVAPDRAEAAVGLAPQGAKEDVP